ncbi:unnamed protein product [Boreogadus saida]
MTNMFTFSRANIRHIGRHEALALRLMKTPAPPSGEQLSAAGPPSAWPPDGNQTARVAPACRSHIVLRFLQVEDIKRFLWAS